MGLAAPNFPVYYNLWTVVTADENMVANMARLSSEHFLNLLAPESFELNFWYIIFKLILEIDGWGISSKLLSTGYHWTLLMISQHWLRQWLGVIRKQAITWINADQELWRHMASLCHNKLIHWGQYKIANVLQTPLSKAYSWMKISILGFKFHWSLFLRIELRICHHYPNQCWPRSMW